MTTTQRSEGMRGPTAPRSPDSGLPHSVTLTSTERTPTVSAVNPGPRWTPMTYRWLLFPSFLSACVTLTPGEGPLIRKGTIEGAKAIDADDLAAGLDQHPPEGWLDRRYARHDPLQVSLDRQRILSYYRDHGHYSARVTDVKVEPFEDGVRVDFVVDEGPAFTLNKVSFVSGSTAGIDLETLAKEELGPRLLVPGQTFVYAEFARAKQALTDGLLRRGYAHATVGGRVVVTEEDAAVEVVIEADPGPLVRFGTISIDPGPLPEEAIRDRLAFRTGDRYNPNLISITEGRIYELSMVGVVSFYLPTDGRPDTLDVRIEIRPGKRNELRIGLGVARQNPNYQMRIRTGYVRRSFFDPRVSVATELRPALLYRPGDDAFSFGIEWSASVTREDFFIPRLTGTAEVQYNLLQYEAYSTLGPAGRLIVDRPLINDRLRLSLAATAKLLGFPRVDDAVPQDAFTTFGLPSCDADCVGSGTPGGLSLLYVEPAVTYDGRDDPIDPRRGIYARLQLEIGRTLNAPGITWMKLTPELRGYVPLWTPRLVFAAKARLGAKLLPGAPLPATQRFFGGGSESQRGFTIRQLSPFFGEGDDAVPVGGESLWELSTEFRVLMFRLAGMWVGAVGFVDAADVGVDFADLELATPHVAAGGGLRLYTPIGPIRVDVGVRLNRVAPGIEPGGGDRVALHLSLGEAF